MNRADLIDKIAENVGSHKCEAEKFVKAYEDVITDCLRQGEKIHLHGFLDFTVKEFEEKDYKNPKTGEESILPATKKVRVSVSKTLNKLI